MIWLFIFGLCSSVCAYIAVPLYFKDVKEVENTSSQQSVLKAYKAELLKVERDLKVDGRGEDYLSPQKSVLEKRLIESAGKPAQISEMVKPVWALGTYVILLTSTLGLYWLIGSPGLTIKNSLKPAVLTASQALSQNTPEPQHANDASMKDLVTGLERKLQTEDASLQQWGLYARSLMTIGRYEDAFKAYEKTLELSGNNPDTLAELKSARAFAAQQSRPLPSTQPGPNKENIAAATQMSEEDRAAMIEGMVEGLAEKLSESPDDPSGWVRLLRARKVLGQSAKAQTEISSMRTHFAKSPDTINQILMQSGWNK